MKTKTLILALICWALITPSLLAQNYGEVLQKSMFFYEAQQAGYLSDNNRVGWRGNAAIEDGSDVGIDLTGGWFDAGDHVKFNFPMAYSVTTLCWSYLENEAAFAATGQTDIFLENIKHTTDYLLKCHTAPNELYAQVGDGDEDHSYWVPAEVIDIRSSRPSFKIDASAPGSDLAGETAAALAAASMVFKASNPTYSATLLEHAEQLYSFADNYRGKYSDVIPVGAFYRSWSGYQDELCWGAIWLYKATNSATYLTKAREEYALLGNEEREEVKSYGWTIAWDDKSYGCYVLMATLTGEAEYMADAERHLDQWFTASSSDSKGPSFTGSGFPILDSWGSFRYAANTSFLLLEQSDNMTDATKQAQYRARAKEITDYLLGDNPQNTSYVIGYGTKYPLYPHHRTAHGPWSREETVPAETRHILYGALVGGHKTTSDTDWTDDRHDYYWNEVACDYNSLWTGVVARLYNDFGGAPATGFPVAETPNGEFLVEVKMNSSGSTHSEYAVWAHNRTAWAARIPSFKFRIFIDITEGIAAGYSVADYIVSANTNNATFTGLLPQDAANNIYYVEVEFNSNVVIYPGGQGECKEESQVRIRLPYDAPASAWDPSNDWSATGVTSILAETNYIPLYANNQLVFGDEPGPVEIIDVTGVSVTPQTLALTINETGSATATVAPANASNKNVSWTSSNEAIATVNADGTISAISAGTATITATTEDGGFTDACVVTVSTIDVTGVSLSSNTLSINKGQTSTLVATVTPSNATNSNVSWSSSNELAATVSTSGVVTAIAEGIATITVITEDGGFTDACAVTITDIIVPTYTLDVTTVGSGSVALSPAGGVYNEGDIVTLTATPLSGYIFDSWSGDLTGTSATATITMDANKLITATFIESPSGGCDYGTPIASGLPTIHGRYDYIYVIGNGPDLSNVTNFTINWDLQNNGLWQMSMNTNNGSPSWWNDLRASATHNFATAGATLTFVGTGFPGLDGNYYAALDGENFVLVEQSGAYTLYFSTTATTPCTKSAFDNNSSFAFSNEFIMFPNPATESVTISGLEMAQSLAIYSLLGQKVYELELNNQADLVIYLDNLNAGTYMVNVNHIDGTNKTSLLMVK